VEAALESVAMGRENDDTLGGRLSTARDAAGLDIKAVANQLGVKLATLQAWESDRAEPRPSRLVNLAGILGVSPVWLMTGQGAGPETDAVASIGLMRAQLSRLTDMYGEMGRLIEGLSANISRLESARQDA
jgi:HTH-type transcriptional regulator, cell division transcriptional repressor